MKTIYFLSVILFLTSCQTLSENASSLYSAITTKPVELNGQNQEEVTKIMGAPIGIDKIGGVFEFWYYKDANQAGFVAFKNGVAYDNGVFKDTGTTVRTESFSAKKEHSKNIAIVSGMERVATKDLSFQSRIVPLVELLKNYGYNIVPVEKTSTYLFVTFGVTDPDVDVKVHSRPVYNWVPGQNTTSFVSNRYGQNVGTINSYSQGYAAYGGQSVTTTKTVNYTTYLNLELTLKSGKSFDQIWKLTSQSTGFSGDISWTLTPVIQASYMFFNINSNGARTTNIPINHPLLAYLQTSR